MRRLFISIKEGTRIALHAIWTNKTRALLTTTCIVIGIVSVTAMNMVSNGVDQSFEESMDVLGRNLVYVEKWPWGLGSGEYEWWDYTNRKEMRLDYMEALAERSQRASVIAGIASRSGQVRFQEREATNISITGATSSYYDLGTIEVEFGRFYSMEEDRRGARVLVLGADVSEVLFPNQSPVNQTVRIQGQRFTVIGTLLAQGDFLGVGQTDTQVFMPISTYEALYGLRSGLQLAVQFPNEAELLEGEYEVEGLMRQIRQLDPVEENDFAINKPSMFEEEFNQMKLIIYGIGIFLTGLALFVGGIGVMNIMFVSVKERTKEIGIRQAVGAKSWEILMQFLIEAVVICLFGGIIGVIVSLGVEMIINQFFVADMDFQIVVNAVLICSFIGVLFGFIPSWKASRADPIESIRYE